MDFHVTIIFAAIFTLLQIPATFFVGFGHIKKKIFAGDGGDPAMLKRIRAHGNYTETVPITLLAMAAADATGVADSILWIGGAMLLPGHLMHFATIGFTEGTGPGRAIGMLLTFAAMGLFAVSALAHAAA